MPPKKKGAAPGGGPLDKPKEELVAVLLADSFAQARATRRGRIGGGLLPPRRGRGRQRGGRMCDARRPPIGAAHPPSRPLLSQALRPVTLEAPKALLPLANAPLIDYSLEWLAASGVDAIIVLCAAHADAVQARLSAAGWLTGASPRVRAVVSTAAASVGDAVRALEQSSKGGGVERGFGGPSRPPMPPPAPHPPTPGRAGGGGGGGGGGAGGI